MVSALKMKEKPTNASPCAIFTFEMEQESDDDECDDMILFSEVAIARTLEL